MMARLQLSLLGSFQAALDGQLLRDFESDKGRALLAYLAVESERAHRREALADLLWPEYAPTTARTNLRNTLSDLRTLLKDREQLPSFLEVTSEAVAFNHASNHQVDVSDFASLLGGERGMGRLERAVTLYRGDFLAGFALKDSAPFEDWVLLVRERLRRGYLDALRELGVWHKGRGEWEQALEDARRWAEADPWDEAAQRELMRLLAESGQRSAALAQYGRCREALAKELEVEPEIATTALYAQIRDGNLAVAPPERRSRLPAPLLPLIGRERELAELLARLREPGCRLLSLVGLGGSGKTRLALEAARQVEGEFARGAHLVSLEAVEGIESMIPAIGQGIGLSFYRQEQSTPKQQLLDYVRDKELLLLLDSCEHLLAGRGLVAEILEAAPQVKILATTRARLGLLGEQCLMLGGLEYPHPALSHREREKATLPSPVERGAGGEGSEGYPAVRLFLEGARQVRMDYEPSPEGLGQIAQLCRWVEGMPLAILLASSWMELLSPGEIVAQMAGADGQRLDLLAADYGDLPERQRSMRAVFDYSWRLLEPRQAEVLATLSVFSSPFTVEAAREVAGASLRDLLHLVDRSLLQRAGMERYSIHDLLRRYAAEQLRSLGGVEAALDRHAAYYARELARRAPDAHRARSSFLHALDAESGNILAAWEWAVARRQLDWLDQAADGFSDWQAFEQQIPSGERLFARAVQAAKALPSSGKQARVSARLLYHQVVFRGHQEDVEAQRALVKECAALIVEAQRLGEDARIEQARVLRRTAYVADSAPECRALLERALSLARETGNGVEEAYSLQGLGNLIASSQPEEGHALQRQALALWREIGDVVEMIESLTVLLPWILYQRRELAEVEQLAREAQALARNLDDPASRALAAQCLAMMLWMRGNLQEGCSVAEEAIRSNEAAGNRFALANLYHCLSHGLLLSGLYAQARENLARALPLAEETGNGAAHFSTRFCQLWLAVAEGAPVAIEQNRHAFDEFCQTSYGPNIPVWANWVRALAAMALGRLDEARRNLLSLARSVAGEGLPGKFVESILPCAALLEAKRGRIERAVELDALWQTFDIALQYRFHVDFFHRPIAEAAKALPPEVVAAAQERGRVRDWEATVQELIAELSAPSNV